MAVSREIMAWWEEGTVVVTVNRRLARYLRTVHERHQLGRGLFAWGSPRIVPLGSWLEEGYGQLLDGAMAEGHSTPPPVLLTPLQERHLWHRVVTEEPPGDAPLLCREDTAREVMAAWNMLREWGLTLPPEEALGHRDGEMFLRWSERFDALCRAGGWLPRAALADALAEGVAALILPPKLALAGFDQLPPQIHRLFRRVAERGVTVRLWDLDRGRVVRLPAAGAEPPVLDPVGGGGHALPGLEPVCCPLPDGEAEVIAAARWCRIWLESRGDGVVGVVVPQLENRREQVVRLFTRVLAPGAEGVENPGEGLFNLSLGSPLSEEPLVADALALLTWQLAGLESTALGRLLQSPFLGEGEAELLARATLEVPLREARRPLWRPDALAALLGDGGRARQAEGGMPGGGDGAPPSETPLPLERRGEGGGGTPPGGPPDEAAPEESFSGPLAGLRRLLARLLAAAPPESATPREWSRHFAHWLQLAGWPGQRTLSSREKQALDAFRERGLGALAAQDRVRGGMTAGEALAQFRAILGDATFQPEGAPAPIQILGALEAVGERFDALWILGMSDDVWPPAPRPNPFLPLAWQRRHQLPRASVERELAFARLVTHRLLGAAAEVVVSHPLREGDQELVVSPLVAHLHAVSLEALVRRPHPAHAEVIQAAGGLVEVPPETPLPIADAAGLAAGASRLRDQAQCPFRAFANHRLGATPLPERPAEVDAMDRGVLVHRVLERFWGEVKRSSDLAAMDERQLRERGEMVVAQVVEDAARKHIRSGEAAPGWWDPLFLERERERLLGLLLAWLALERQRPDPFEVAGEESAAAVTLAGLPVALRLDRLDRLADGRLVIIDYKTGTPSVKAWFGERPGEPQLPLYCLAAPAPVAALAYGRVRTGQVGFLGVAASGELLPGVKALEKSRMAPEGLAWEELADHWRQTLTALAREHLAGEAGVDPQPGACDHCELLLLCRVRELSPEGAVETDGDDPAEEEGA